MITFSVIHLIKTVAFILALSSGLDLYMYEHHTVEATPLLKIGELIVFVTSFIIVLLPL